MSSDPWGGHDPVPFNTLRERIKALEVIPANEQCIGHFQLAVQMLLLEFLDKLERKLVDF